MNQNVIDLIVWEVKKNTESWIIWTCLEATKNVLYIYMLCLSKSLYNPPVFPRWLSCPNTRTLDRRGSIQLPPETSWVPQRSVPPDNLYLTLFPQTSALALASGFSSSLFLFRGVPAHPRNASRQWSPERKTAHCRFFWLDSVLPRGAEWERAS